MRQIKVVFYKEINGKLPFDVQLVKVEFAHLCNNQVSDYENLCDAFDKACQLGLDATKQLTFKFEDVD